MGLDMYLSKKTYVKNWNHTEPENRHEVSVKRGGNVVDHIKPERVSYITEDVAYWRKFNALHAWFVENIQEGKDDCGEYYVSKSDLQDLLVILKKIMANHELAPSLLPTQSGFFFGTVDYDAWYFKDVERTVQILEELFEEEDKGDFYYSSSW